MNIMNFVIDPNFDLTLSLSTLEQKWDLSVIITKDLKQHEKIEKICKTVNMVIEYYDS